MILILIALRFIYYVSLWQLYLFYIYVLLSREMIDCIIFLVHCLPSDHGSLCGLKNEVCVCVRVSALSDKKAFLSSAAFRRRAAFTAIRSGM